MWSQGHISGCVHLRYEPLLKRTFVVIPHGYMDAYGLTALKVWKYTPQHKSTVEAYTARFGGGRDHLQGHLIGVPHFPG